MMKKNDEKKKRLKRKNNNKNERFFFMLKNIQSVHLSLFLLIADGIMHTTNPFQSR